MFGDFWHRQTRKESQGDHFGSTRVDRFKAAEGTFEGEKVLDWHGRSLRRVQQIVELDVREATPSLLTFLVPTMIHEHAPHGLRGQRECLRAAW
jgi:hypothetical protein